MAALFSNLPKHESDPIFALMESFTRDPRSAKVSLSIGLYFDEAGRVPVLESVRRAREILFKRGGPSFYLPIEGAPGFRQSVQHVVFGESHPSVQEGRIATIASLGGSGALRVGAEFLRSQLGCTNVYVPDPTWDNHVALFKYAGFEVGTYPYFDAETEGLRIEAMLECLRMLPEKSVILLHASCHNPTGKDLNVAQWKAVSQLMRQRGHVPFVDMAYQGFGDGLDEDASAVRLLAQDGHEFLVANSFSKNFSIYGERAGGLSLVCRNGDAAAATLGHLKLVVRGNYSTPAAHGAALVEQVLSSNELRALWVSELAGMRVRIRDMRARLHAAMVLRCGDRHAFDYLLDQRGMFSYTGLASDQVRTLREHHAIYLVESGRMCMSGLTPHNIEHVADAIAAVLDAETCQ